jgi:hypothetical protein
MTTCPGFVLLPSDRYKGWTTVADANHVNLPMNFKVSRSSEKVASCVVMKYDSVLLFLMEDFLITCFDEIQLLIICVTDSSQQNLNDLLLAAELCTVRIGHFVQILSTEIRNGQNNILRRIEGVPSTETDVKQHPKESETIEPLRQQPLGLLLNGCFIDETARTVSTHSNDFMVLMDQTSAKEFTNHVIINTSTLSRGHSSVILSYASSPSQNLNEFIMVNEERTKIPVVAIIQPLSLTDLSLLGLSDVIKTLFFQVQDSVVSDFLKTLHPSKSVMFPRSRQLHITLILSRNPNGSVRFKSFDILYKMIAALVRTVRKETLGVFLYFITNSHESFTKDVGFTDSAVDLLRCIDISKRITVKCVKTGTVFYSSLN